MTTMNPKIELDEDALVELLAAGVQNKQLQETVEQQKENIGDLKLQRSVLRIRNIQLKRKNDKIACERDQLIEMLESDEKNVDQDRVQKVDARTVFCQQLMGINVEMARENETLHDVNQLSQELIVAKDKEIEILKKEKELAKQQELSMKMALLMNQENHRKAMKKKFGQKFVKRKWSKK